MKIAIVEPVGGHGGMNYYDLGLSRGLVDAGVDVIWYTSDATKEENEQGIQIKKIYRGVFGEAPKLVRGLRYIAATFKTARDCRREHIRIAHLHFFHYSAIYLISALILKLFGIKIVSTMHDIESFFEDGQRNHLIPIARASSHLIAHNEFSRQQLNHLLKKNLPELPISVIPHGNYVEFREHSVHDPNRQELGLSTDDKVILFFGQIKKVKGLDILLRAFSRYRCDGGRGILVIAGKTWKDDFAEYDHLIEELGIRDALRLHIRYINDEEVSAFYGAADLVVLPYRRIYQSGVLLMAMSYEKAVLVSNLEPMTDIVTDRVNGFTFETENEETLAIAISDILLDTPVREQAARKALADMKEHYSWQVIGRKTLDVYASLKTEGASQE